MAKLEARSAPRTDTLGDLLLKVEKGKGKDKISYTRPTPDPLPAASTSRGDPGEEKPAQAWWLDVASPSWEDMRMLGKASSSLFQKSQMVVPSKRKKGGGVPTNAHNQQTSEMQRTGRKRWARAWGQGEGGVG